MTLATIDQAAAPLITTHTDIHPITTTQEPTQRPLQPIITLLTGEAIIGEETGLLPTTGEIGAHAADHTPALVQAAQPKLLDGTHAAEATLVAAALVQLPALTGTPAADHIPALVALKTL